MKRPRLLILALIALSFALSSCSAENIAAAPTEAADAGYVTVTFIDVGQGDSTLIRTENHAMLIDGGIRAAYQRIFATLWLEGISHLDYVVATHPHADHIGGLVPLIGNDNGISVGTVIMPNVVHTTRTYEMFLEALIESGVDVAEPYPGKVLELDGAVFTIVAPNSSGYGNLNNYSVVVIMDHGDNSFLFAADAERESELEILEYFEDISADVLRVGHHGSRTSSSPAFLDAVAPRYAVISAGKGNQYGHPHDVVVERLLERGVHIMVTYELGSIVMVSDGSDIEVRLCQLDL